MKVTPRRVLTKEQKLRRAEIVAQQTLSAMLWAWFALACCAGDAITAIGLLILKSLVWSTIKPMTFDELEEKRNER